MASARDVAAYILQRQGQMTTWKLQKLVYYSQAWHLVWEEQPLFDDRIEAWANGPVIPTLYQAHRQAFTLDATWAYGNPTALSSQERTAIDTVLDFYGSQSGQWLSELSHSEPPWLKTREGLSPTQRGSREITQQDMAEYFGGLVAQ